MSELSQIVEEKENRIKSLSEMNYFYNVEVDEYLRVTVDATANIVSRRQLIKENEEEISKLKTNLEEYEALRQ